jgi:glycosyltransferase involved in cell wall biosynthesis
MTLYPNELRAPSADIALILESSYPYILGGVSAWVQQLIENFPNYTFALIFLGGAPENYKEGIRYKLPPNVTHFQVHYLFDEDPPSRARKKLSTQKNEQVFKIIRSIHDSFRCQHMESMKQLGNLDLFQKETGIDYDEFLYSEASWDFITEQYAAHCEDSSFIDYFWTIRNLHKPLWKCANIIHSFPKVKVVHTASTGYAGLLSFFVNQHYQFPMMLTEHGIYTRERRIDVFLSKNFRDDYVVDRPLTEMSYLRNLWDRYFKTLAQLCYNAATPIISLSKAAHEIQIEEGADPKKTIIIANGVDIDRFKRLRRTYAEKCADTEGPIVCFVGRLVPMKDVKGFIRSIPNVHRQIPNSKFWIIGSTDQDPEYARECHELVENISLQDIVEFQLHQNMEDILPKIHLLVLSALREGMPLIVLECFAAGIPVVVTDTGACAELVLGQTDEDRAIGPAGIVTKVGDSKALEHAMIELLTQQATWEHMSQAGITRAERYYDQTLLIEKYGELYQTRIN